MLATFSGKMGSPISHHPLLVFQEGLGSILKVFQEGLVHNVNSMSKHVGHGSGWAGGVTRSVKNSNGSDRIGRRL